MKKINRRSQGQQLETLAAAFLEEHGVRITDRNFHDGRAGEIDLIGYDGRTLVFFEVKYRRSTASGTPEEAVTLRKQQTISRAALFYLYLHHRTEEPVRFDVVAMTQQAPGQVHVRWIRDAFPFRGR